MPKHLSVQKSDKGRRLAISDIHGCSQTFEALLTKINLQKEDQLFLLGDYINRGPDSLRVIKKILSLIDQDFQVYCLRGNHEQMVLDVMRRWPLQLKPLLKKYKSSNLLNKEGHLKAKVFSFFQECLYYIELDDYYLVHAGFDFKKEKPLKDFEAMLNIRKFEPSYELIAKKKIVHGHYRHSLKFINKRLEKNALVLPIDNGCSSKKIKGQGSLVCLNLDDLSLIVQENCE